MFGAYERFSILGVVVGKVNLKLEFTLGLW
jgi:hypothetical protein